MLRINVIVATGSPDVMAEVVAASIAVREDMNLVAGRCLSIAEVDQILESDTSLESFAVVVIGHPSETLELQQRWLAARQDLVVMLVDIVGDVVRIGLRDPRLDWLLTSLRELVERFGHESRERFAHVQLQIGELMVDNRESRQAPIQTPLLDASIDWVRALLRSSVDSMPGENGDVHGFALTRSTVTQSLNAPPTVDNQESGLKDAEETLDIALADRDNPEPLAVVAAVFGLQPLEFRVMVLTLAPELDFRFQRCLGFLLDDLSHRVGTLGLYASLLHMTPRQLGEIRGGALARWQVFDGPIGYHAADESARIDPFLVQWILGQKSALESDPRVTSVLRIERWPGALLLTGSREQHNSQRLVEKLHEMGGLQLLVLNGREFADWRALLELGSELTGVGLMRFEVARLKGLELHDIHLCAQHLARNARLTGKILAVDMATSEINEAEHTGIRNFFTTLRNMDCGAALVCPDLAQMVPFLDGVSFLPVKGEPICAESRLDAVREAASLAGVRRPLDPADQVANRFPLSVEGLEHAVRLANIRPVVETGGEPELERFYGACKDLASRGVSDLVDRIDPVFTLDDVVLAPDRKRQLYEIIDHVRLAERVLNGWNFGEKLPYGRGVTALFSGVSGTGKTMAAMGIANSLGIQILRLDLSKIVSKYIGETEKNIARVFTDAQRSGAAVLIDEADALLGKRSEVKLAQDRYANIEVAYLLQCLEAFEGLVILTTNMRQNLDSAFLRRLRFMIPFDKPDCDARETIWRQCLPAESHDLDDGEFRHLARRVELTGGQIRQITLRAAFIAAAADNLIGIEDISRATLAELTKLGLPPIEIVQTEIRRAA